MDCMLCGALITRDSRNRADATPREVSYRIAIAALVHVERIFDFQMLPAGLDKTAAARVVKHRGCYS